MHAHVGGDTLKPVPENRKISHFLTFYLMASMQIGVGVLGFQRIIARIAGYDSWISVIIAGVSTNIIMWFMYKLMENSNGDLIDVHRGLFGKWIGTLANFGFVLYFIALLITVLRTYIELVEVWMFPDFSTFWFGTAFLLLCIYIIYGGFRTVTGIAFFAFVLPLYITIIFGLALSFSDFRHFLPIWDHSFKEIMNASQSMSLTYTGYEIIVFFYPFIKDPEKSKKWTHFGLIFTMILYLYTVFVSFSFYTQEQLSKNIWATLTTFKIVHLPVAERFEYIGIANWCLIILPKVCLSLWCAARILKKTVKLNQRIGVFLISALSLFSMMFFKTRGQIDFLNVFAGGAGFLVNYFYIPLLTVLVLFVNKMKKGKKTQ
jgi:spore germination protein (amino acid permease)